MRTHTAVILAAAGGLVLAAGWHFGPSSVPTATSTTAPGTLIFPGMAAKLQTAARVEITSKGNLMVISRTGQAGQWGPWGLADRGGFRVQQDKLRELLTGLTELRITEARTADPTQYGRLGVGDPKDVNGTANLLIVKNDKGETLVEIIVGHRRVRTAGNVPETIYLRRPAEAQSWLAEGRLPVDADPALWFDRDIANITKDKVASVTIERDGTTMEFAMVDGKPTLLSPAVADKLDDYRVEDVFRSLEMLTLTDVRPLSDAKGEQIGTAEIRLADGGKIAVTVARAGPDVWIQLSADGDSVKDIATRAAGWSFQVGAWKEKAFVPALEDLKAEAPAKPDDKPVE
jgi:hypothetical protein